MADWTTPKIWVPDELVSAADFTAYTGNIGYLGEQMPKRAHAFHYMSTVTVGNALATLISTSQIQGIYSYQNAAANGDTFTLSFWLAAGTYTLYALGVTFNNRGNVDWYLSSNNLTSTLLGSTDWYSAGATYNVVLSVGSIVITAPARYTLTGVVNGKNASSSDYFVALTEIWMKQASDG